MSKGLGDILTAVDSTGVAVTKTGAADEVLSIKGYYTVECFDADGVLKWSDDIKNLVVTVGKNDMLDKYFAGSTYTAAWYMGLVDNTSFSAYAAGDTLASHAGWLEFLSYTGANRATAAWSAASAGAKSTTATAFNINATGTVLGALMCTTQAKNTTSNGGAGILFSAGTFSGGARSVVSGDVVNVTWTCSL